MTGKTHSLSHYFEERLDLTESRGITRMTWSRFLTKDYRYRIVLETDSAEYGGHKRLDPNCEYFVDSQPWHDRPFSLLVSLLCGGNSNAALLSTTLRPQILSFFFVAYFSFYSYPGICPTHRHWLHCPKFLYICAFLFCRSTFLAVQP